MATKNPLLATDIYKLGHMEQYVPGCTKVYSYLSARNSSEFNQLVFFGLQYYLKEFLTIPLTKSMANELLLYRQKLLGQNSPDVIKKVNKLVKLGYFPIEIKAIAEGSLVETKQVLMTITNTHPDFFWVVGFLESLLLKVWYSSTVATVSYNYKLILKKYFDISVPKKHWGNMNFNVHDFGYRGSSSEDSAQLSGAAHLINFNGCETLTALPFIQNYYNGDCLELNISAIPATEHSVMSSYGEEGEYAAFEHLLKLYFNSSISIVSDTYNIYRVVNEYLPKLKSLILERKEKLVIRPDSGNPINVIFGDPTAAKNSPQYNGILKILEKTFGTQYNELGFKELHPKIGIIVGDGMDLETYENMLRLFIKKKYSASNLIIGVGKFLRNYTRDTLGFAIKASYIEINGKPLNIYKKPITDLQKKSYTGLLKLSKKIKQYSTHEKCTWEQEQSGELKTVFKDGKIINEYSFEEIRNQNKLLKK